jgi:hypothetical protein
VQVTVPLGPGPFEVAGVKVHDTVSTTVGGGCCNRLIDRYARTPGVPEIRENASLTRRTEECSVLGGAVGRRSRSRLNGCEVEGYEMLHKTLAGIGVSTLATVAMGGTAFADHCTNIQRDEHDPSKGVQVIIDASTEEGTIEWANPGVLNRVSNGLIDPETGEGFHGLVGLDFDGDGTVDAMTYLVGPEGDALPETAINNGSPDHGIVHIGVLFGP